MKATKVFQLLLVLATAGYLLWFHNVNPGEVRLPLFGSLPPALLVLVAMLLAWLFTWLSLQGRLWGLGRENRKLKRQLAELESKLAVKSVPQAPLTPVIPDRSDGWQSEGDLSEGDLSERGR